MNAAQIKALVVETVEHELAKRTGQSTSAVSDTTADVFDSLSLDQRVARLVSAWYTVVPYIDVEELRNLVLIAAFESNLRMNIKATNSPAFGLYQFMPGTIKELVRRDPSLEKWKSSLLATVRAEWALWKEHDRALLRAGVNRNLGNRYAMHLLGQPQAEKLFRNPDSLVSDLLSSKVIRSNRGVLDGTRTARVQLEALDSFVLAQPRVMEVANAFSGFKSSTSV